MCAFNLSNININLRDYYIINKLFIYRSTLINHNLRWIDWPHSHGDPNEYWNKLGARQYIGGPRVLNASELRQVLASPYLFARKVDVSVDAEVR